MDIELAQALQEIEELKDKLKNLSNVAEVRLANWQKYEKENAELKEITVMQSDFAKQLDKAKELIKELLLNYTYVMKFHKYKNRDLIERAEQFISEVEK